MQQNKLCILLTIAVKSRYMSAFHLSVTLNQSDHSPRTSFLPVFFFFPFILRSTLEIPEAQLKPRLVKAIESKATEIPFSLILMFDVIK